MQILFPEHSHVDNATVRIKISPFHHCMRNTCEFLRTQRNIQKICSISSVDKFLQKKLSHLTGAKKVFQEYIMHFRLLQQKLIEKCLQSLLILIKK